MFTREIMQEWMDSVNDIGAPKDQDLAICMGAKAATCYSIYPDPEQAVAQLGVEMSYDYDFYANNPNEKVLEYVDFLRALAQSIGDPKAVTWAELYHNENTTDINKQFIYNLHMFYSLWEMQGELFV